MRLTALCVCGTLLAFCSLSWTTADHDEGDHLGDHGFGPCDATLRPEGPCTQRQDGSTCPYLFTLPPLTVHLPTQLIALQEIVKDLQNLKDNVDQLRKMCADCTVSQPESVCGKQSEIEHDKLNEGTVRYKDERKLLNERNPERQKDFSQGCGTNRVKEERILGGDGDTVSEKRTTLDESERNKLEAETESNKALVKERGREEDDDEQVAEIDGKSKTEGAKGKDKLGQPAGQSDRIGDMVPKKVVVNTNSEADRNKDKKGTENSKGDQEDNLKNGKESQITINIDNEDKTEKIEHHVWQDEIKETEKKTQTEEDSGRDRIKMYEDHGENTNKGQEQDGEKRKKEMEKGIKVGQNNEKPDRTERIGHAEKEKTIKQGEAYEDSDGEKGKAIETEGEKPSQSVQRDSDIEIASNKAKERTDFVSISTTLHSTISLAQRHDFMDSNEAITVTSSFPASSIADVNQRRTITADGLLMHNTGHETAGTPEQPSPDEEAGGFEALSKTTTTATMSRMGGPRQQLTSATTTFTPIAGAAGPDTGFNTPVSSIANQNLYTTTFPGVTDRDRWAARRNISSNTKTGKKPPPGHGPKPGEKHETAIKTEADRRLKNPKNNHKPDGAPLPDKLTKNDQKQKPPNRKPTMDQKAKKPGKDPKQVEIPKPDQRPLPDTYPTDQNLKNIHTPEHGQEQTTKPNQLPIQKPPFNQKPMRPVQRPTSHQKPQTVNATGSDKNPATDQDHKSVDEGINNQNSKPDKKPVQSLQTDKPDQQKKPYKKPQSEEKTKPDQRPLPDNYPTDQNQKNIRTPEHAQEQTTEPNRLSIQKPPFNRRPTRPVQRPTSHQKPQTVNATSSDKNPATDQDPKSVDEGINNQNSKPDKKPVQSLQTDKPDQQKKPYTKPQSEEKTKPDQRPLPDNYPTDQSLQNVRTPEHGQEQTTQPNRLLIQKPPFNQKPMHPIQRPTSHQKPQTVNATGSDKNPVTDQDPKSVDEEINNQNSKPDKKPVQSLQTDKPDQQKKPYKKPQSEEKTKPDQRPLPDNYPTDQNLQNVRTPEHGQEQTTQPNRLLIQKPPFNQKPMRPVQRPTSHQKPQTVNATGSDKNPVTDQDPKSVDEEINNQNSKPDKKPVQSLQTDKPDQHKKPYKKPQSEEKTKPDQRPLPDNYPTDQNLQNVRTPERGQEQTTQPNRLLIQKPPFNQKPTRPVQRPTSHQKPQTVNATGSDKNPATDQDPKSVDEGINNQNSKPDKKPVQSLQTDKPDQKKKPYKKTHSEEKTKPDQRPLPDNYPTDQNLQNVRTPEHGQEQTTQPNRLPIQKPPFNQKPMRPVQRPTSHQIPQTVNATGSDKNPATDQDPKSVDEGINNQNSKPDKKPIQSLQTDKPDQQKKPYKKTQSEEKTKPDQRPLPDNYPTDQNRKNVHTPEHGQEQTTQPNLLPIQKPPFNRKPMRPVQRPTSHQKPQTVNANPATDQNSKPDKPLQTLQTDNPDQQKNPYKKSEEKEKPYQRTIFNQYSTPFPKPEPEGSETTSLTPKPNQKSVIESMDNAEENPLIEPSVKDPTHGQTPDQTLKHGQKLHKINQKPKPDQAPKLNQKHPDLTTGQKTRPNVKPKPDQTPKANQRHKEPLPDQMPNLKLKTVSDEVPAAESNRTTKPRLPPRRKQPSRPTAKPGATPIQRPKPSVQLKHGPNTKTNSDPRQTSRKILDGLQNSQTDMPPASGPVKLVYEATHSPGETGKMKTIIPGPKTSSGRETGPFPHLHTHLEGFTTSPNSRITSDLGPHPAGQPPLIQMTPRPNKILHGILPIVIPGTSPESTKPNQGSNSDRSNQAKIVTNREETLSRKTIDSGKIMVSVPSTSAKIKPADLWSTTPAPYGPAPLDIESTTPSARELRVKINQVAAFFNKSQSPNKRPADISPKKHPEDNQGGSRPDRTNIRLPSKVNRAERDCSDHVLKGHTKSGVYVVTPDLRTNKHPVFCDMEVDGGGWTVLQKRQDGSLSFNRSWDDYRTGFGEVDATEFWLGNNMIHLLTRERDMVLRVELTDHEGVHRYAEYAQFKVASERLRFRLTVDGYSGTAGDALRFSEIYNHNNRAFTTPDRDNDRYPSGNCGAYYSSGWWFDACLAANLNGRYYVGTYKGIRDGIFWGTWHNISAEYYPTSDRRSFKTVSMMIRPKSYVS